MTVFRHADPAAFLAAAAPVTARNPAVAAFADAWALRAAARSAAAVGAQLPRDVRRRRRTGVAMQRRRRGRGHRRLRSAAPRRRSPTTSPPSTSGLQGVVGGLGACTAFAGALARAHRPHARRAGPPAPSRADDGRRPARAARGAAARAAATTPTGWSRSCSRSSPKPACPTTKERIGTVVPRRVARRPVPDLGGRRRARRARRLHRRRGARRARRPGVDAGRAARGAATRRRWSRRCRASCSPPARRGCS